MSEVAEHLDRIGRAFEEYKSVNDARLAELAKKGAADPLIDDKLAKLDAAMDAFKARVDSLETRAARPGTADGEKGRVSAEAAEYKTAFLAWVRNPRDPQREMRLQAAGKALATKSRVGDDLETRATQVVTSSGAAGGYALPEQIERQIASIGRDISPIRQIATVRMVGTSDYKELISVNGAGAEWLGETATRNQTNTSNLAEVAPTFGLLSAKPQASEESLDDLFFDVEAWVIAEAANEMAQEEGLAFVSGNGSNKPTGFLAGPTPVSTADSSRAFGTLQYVAGGQASAMPTDPDKFLDIVYALRARYRANARWVTSKAVLASLRKYKESTTNAYMWAPGLAGGQPDTFLGYPITEAEDMPAVGAGEFPLAFGDFREGYLIADRVGMRMTRDEITSPGFVKFYVRKRVGGILRNTEAIKLLKIATS